RRRVVDARYGGERPRFGDRRKGVFRRRGPSRTSHNRAGTSRTRAWVDSHPSSCSGGIVMTPTHMRHRTALGAAGVAAGLVALVGCSGGGAADGGTSGDDQVTVTNCGEKRTYPQPAERLFVNGDGNMMATVLAVGAAEQVVGVGGLGEAVETLGTVYGEDRVDELPVVSDNYPSFENVIAQTPDVVFSGWGYGWEEKTNLTPDGLAQHDIAAYTLTESCRQGSDGDRGTLPPWEALFSDLKNLGKIKGNQARAQDVVTDIKQRLEALRSAPQPDDPPTVFLFDSGTKDVFSSGAFGGPQAIIEAAGGRNALEDVQDTWTTVSWERVASSKPDFIAFVDYGEQTFQEKVEVLRNNPATKNLPAVKQERFLNIPISAWTSGPMNINTAEQLRVALEKRDLVPDSDIEAEHDLTP